MEFLDKIRDRIQGLEEKELRKYLIVFLACLLLIISFMVFRYFYKISALESRIEDINELRVDEVRRLLSRAEDVKKRKEEVNKLIEEEDDFKIIEYFEGLLKKLRLSAVEVVPSRKMLEGDYIESELVTRIDGVSMRQLCELLQELDKKKRIYTKKLEIKKSSKIPKTIDVTITIATLLPKTEEEAT